MRTVAAATFSVLDGTVLDCGPMGATLAGGAAIPVEPIEGVAG
jgi:hypothetical protein